MTGSARRHYVYNELDQLREERLGTSLGASTLDKSYTWDKYGRMASEGGAGVPPAIDRLYKWTVDDRLVSVVLGDNPSNDPVIKYAYDHLGTRVSRSALGETAKHLTDYENPSGYSQTLAEVEGDGLNVLKNYFYGSEYGPLAQRGAGANSLAFLHGDHLQTTRQLTDSEGDVLLASSQKYEPFGTPTPDGLSSLTSYAFTGQSRDLDTGLQYHRARWLNTNQGRWLSTDPVFDFPGNFGSGYGYGGSSPARFADRTGESILMEAVGFSTVMELVTLQLTTGQAILEQASNVVLLTSVKTESEMTLLMVTTLVVVAVVAAVLADLYWQLIISVVLALTRIIYGLWRGATGGAIGRSAYALYRMGTRFRHFQGELKAFRTLLAEDIAQTAKMIRKGEKGFAHGLTRHGWQVDAETLRQRSISGIVPDTGEAGRVVPSTKFNSYQDQLAAKRALEAEAKRLIAAGADPREACVVTMPSGVGSGWTKANKAGEQAYVEGTKRAQAFYDSDGELISFFPILK